MCGFAGFLGYRFDIAMLSSVIASRMASAINHRGPDDSGVWIDESCEIALSHRRLSILDVSSAGHQPMLSPTERYVIAFNGEIYNHLALRHRLESVGYSNWRGHSDTETLLAAFDVWGIEETLRSCVGMFAFALWDRKTKCITLARDRIGEKPLYYGWQSGVFLFGSELKALKAHPAFVGAINRDAISLFLRHNYIPSPHTIYQGVNKLMPGCFLQLTADGKEKLQAYWTANDSVLVGKRQQFSGDENDACIEAERLINLAVEGQMIADVPIGAFLSGGIDSSLVVSIMQKQSAQPVKTFTIGFNEKGYNEAFHARAVAKHLGTEHTELYVTPEEAQELIPRLPIIYDEPFSDPSQIPNFIVSELASKSVKVALSGDGGDELFAGYSRYSRISKIWNRLEKIPRFMKKGSSNFINSIFVNALTQSFSPLCDSLNGRICGFSEKIDKLSGILGTDDEVEFYRYFISHCQNPDEIILGGSEPKTYLDKNEMVKSARGIQEKMMMLDMLTYLPDDILVKVDRAGMAVSLETRIPFLDQRIIEFSWSLPDSMKMREGQGKWILREILFKHVPKELVDRPKMGFSVPIGEWLRGPLRQWAEELIDESRLNREGIFKSGPIRKKWTEHLSGKCNWEYHLWDVLIFQAWLEAQC